MKSTDQGRQPALAETLNTSVRFTGPGVLAAIEAVGASRMRNRSGKGWLVPITRAADVIAYIEHVQRRRVEVIEKAALR